MSPLRQGLNYRSACDGNYTASAMAKVKSMYSAKKLTNLLLLLLPLPLPLPLLLVLHCYCYYYEYKKLS